MKLIYVSNSVFPSNAANSVHVMKMCEAFSDIGMEVVLYGLKGDKKLNNLYEYYGVKNNFKIELLTSKQLPARLYLYAIWVTLKLLIINLKIKKRIWKHWEIY